MRSHLNLSFVGKRILRKGKLLHPLGLNQKPRHDLFPFANRANRKVKLGRKVPRVEGKN
jgi:hypothetical protein